MTVRNCLKGSIMLACPKDPSRFHTFRIDDAAFVLDVNSGNSFRVDELTWNILQLCPHHSASEIVESLSRRFPASAVVEAMAELEAAEREEHLFTEPWDDPVGLKEPPIGCLTLNVAHDCNLRCRYCYAASGTYGGRRMLMAEETARRAFDFAFARSEGVKTEDLCFYGGEPLLNFGVIRSTVKYARRRCAGTGTEVRFHVTTNGTLLTPDIMDFLADEGFSAIVSLDGPAELHDRQRPFADGRGSHGEVLKRVLAFHQRMDHSRVTVRSTFTGIDHDLCTMYKYLTGLGFDSVSIEPAFYLPPSHPMALGPDNLPSVRQSYRDLAELYLARIKAGDRCTFFHLRLVLDKIRIARRAYSECGAAQGYVAVAPSGDIYPCHVLAGHDKVRLGSVLDGSFSLEVSHRFRDAQLLNKPRCAECWARYHCGGGCHALAEYYNGDIMQPWDLDCELTQWRIALGLYVYGRLVEEAPERLEAFYESTEGSMPRDQAELRQGL